MKRLMTLAVTLFCLTSAAQADTASELKNLANLMNRDVPLQIDRLTTLIYTHAVGSTFVYSYKLRTAPLDSDKIFQVKKSMRVNQVNAFCTEPALKAFRDMDVTLSYNYSYENGRFMFNNNVSNADCHKLVM